MSSSLFALTDLEASIPGLVPSSFVAKDDASFFLQRAGTSSASESSRSSLFGKCNGRGARGPT